MEVWNALRILVLLHRKEFAMIFKVNRWKWTYRPHECDFLFILDYRCFGLMNFTPKDGLNLNTLVDRERERVGENICMCVRFFIGTTFLFFYFFGSECVCDYREKKKTSSNVFYIWHAWVGI